MNNSCQVENRLLHIVAYLILGTALLCHARTVSSAERAQSYTRTEEVLSIPPVTLVNQDGVKVQLTEFLATDRPVIIDFVFTTCTTICPVMTSNFAGIQKTLSRENGRVQLVSITVDPEYDRPAELKAYMKRFQAKPGWDFLTGAPEDIVRVLKAFKVFTGNKMTHPPVFWLKSPANPRWVRLYGMLSREKLLVEYEKVRS